MRKVCFFLFLVVFSTVSFATPIPNGSFEDGLNGWTADGNIEVVTSYTASYHDGSIVKMLPTDGKNFAIITTGEYTSSLTSSIMHVEEGKHYGFNWFFDASNVLSIDPGGMFSIALEIGGFIFSKILAIDFFDFYVYPDGWQHYDFVAPKSGDVKFVFFASDTYFGSPYDVLGIDQVYGDVQVSVPEPSAVLLLAIGIFALGLFTRRKTTGELGGFAA